MSVETNKKFGLLKGLSDIHICRIFDSAEGYTPEGTPEQLIPAGEMSVGKSIEKKRFILTTVCLTKSAKKRRAKCRL